MVIDIAVAIDGYTVQKDLNRLVRRGEKEALIDSCIRRDVNTYPYTPRPLGNRNTELRIEPAPCSLLLWECRNCSRRFFIYKRPRRLPILPRE